MTALTHSYLFALVDGGGTVPPELAVVRRMIERGHEVTVLAEHTMAEEVRATGATFRSWEQAPNRASRLPEDDPFRDWDCKNPMQLINRLLDTMLATPAPAYAADVDDAIAVRQPDVVVCSQFALGAMVAAESAGIPFFVLMPNIYLLPAEGMPPFGMGFQPANGTLGRLRDRVVGRVNRRLFDKGLDRINALRRSRGLEPLAHFWDQVNHAHRQLVLTSPAFDFPAELPEGVRYVGAQLDDPAWVEAWQAPVGDHPLVLVALSSTFQEQIGCMQRIADALGTLPVRALLTTGPAIDPSALHPPGNVVVVRSAPHSRVLAQADAVVTHGGHGTVIKALAAGVPMVVMPHGRDQADNAARVVARGAGIAVKRTAKTDAIASAVRTVVEQAQYRERAGDLGAAVRRDAASDAVVDELANLPSLSASARPVERCT